MTYLTLIFPIIVMNLITLLFLPCFRFILRPAACPSLKDKRMVRRDYITVLVLTLIYGVIAFIGLGDRKGIQSFCYFEKGDSALIELNKPVRLSSVMYFSGIFNGNYNLDLSFEDSDKREALELPQMHKNNLNWGRIEVPEGYGSVKTIRITADNPMVLGEIAFFDSDGKKVNMEGARIDSFAQPAFDEQDNVPDSPYYLNGTYFDEGYHVRSAFEHIENIWPYELTHPPLGKIIISLGIRLFGLTPFGWRFMGTLCGVLMLPFMYLFLKKLFGGFIIPCCGTLIFTFDFMHYVQTRIATIDSYGVFFILLMYLFFWMYLCAPRGEGSSRREWLPYLALSGLSFGLGAASKWICLYGGAGLALIWLIDRVHRGVTLCRSGKSRAYAKETLENVLWCLLFFVLIPAVIYYLSYYPYGCAKGLNGISMFFKREYLDLVLENQRFMLTYHVGVHEPHPYASRWYEWILDIRPILFYMNDFSDGTRSSIASFVNPALCWGGLACVLLIMPRAILLRDKRAGFLCLGYLANLLPWIFIHRILFAYHYFAMTVFLVPALCSVFAPLEKEEPKTFRHSIYGFTALCIILFAAFYPVLSGIRTPVWYTSGFLRWVSGFWPF